MALKPEMSLLGGLATGAVDVAIFQLMMPNATDLKQVQPYNRDVESSRKTATIVALGVTGGISLLARDPGIFIVGGFIAVGISLLYAHADAVSPLTGKVTDLARGGLSSVPGGVSNTPKSADVLYVDEQVA